MITDLHFSDCIITMEAGLYVICELHLVSCLILVDEKITLVEKKSQFQSNKKKETAPSSEEKTTDKSDDPIRMYLREMGGVELLSREGEIAIAKRIEAGKDVMINALTQSPIIGKKIFEWKDQIENQSLLVRDIIDIDSTCLLYTSDACRRAI